MAKIFKIVFNVRKLACGSQFASLPIITLISSRLGTELQKEKQNKKQSSLKMIYRPPCRSPVLLSMFALENFIILNVEYYLEQIKSAVMLTSAFKIIEYVIECIYTRKFPGDAFLLISVLIKVVVERVRSNSIKSILA